MLETDGYNVHEARPGRAGSRKPPRVRPGCHRCSISACPICDGLDVLQRLREWSEVPVIVLSVRDDEQGKVAALDAGADDYVTKPFSTAELLARLRAAQRKTRPAEDTSDLTTSAALVVDLSARVRHPRQSARSN